MHFGDNTSTFRTIMMTVLEQMGSPLWVTHRRSGNVERCGIAFNWRGGDASPVAAAKLLIIPSTSSFIIPIHATVTLSPWWTSAPDVYVLHGRGAHTPRPTPCIWDYIRQACITFCISKQQSFITSRTGLSFYRNVTTLRSGLCNRKFVCRL